MRCALQAIVIGLITSAFAVADDEPAQQDVKALIGKWRVTRFEYKGKVAPEDEARATLVIEAGGKCVLTPEGRPGGEFSYAIDASKSPK